MGKLYLTYLSIYPSIRFFSAATGHSFGVIFTINGSNDVISQPLVPFGGHINIVLDVIRGRLANNHIIMIRQESKLLCPTKLS